MNKLQKRNILYQENKLWLVCHLLENIQSHRVEHVVNNDSQNWTGSCSKSFLYVWAWRTTRLDCWHSLKHCLGPLKRKKRKERRITTMSNVKTSTVKKKKNFCAFSFTTTATLSEKSTTARKCHGTLWDRSCCSRKPEAVGWATFEKMFDSRLLYRRKLHIFHSKRAKRVAVRTSIVDLRTFSMINTWSGLFDNATKCVKKYILSWSFHTRWIELPSETWEANDCGTLHTVGFSTNGYKRNNTVIRWFFFCIFSYLPCNFQSPPNILWQPPHCKTLVYYSTKTNWNC